MQRILLVGFVAVIVCATCSAPMARTSCITKGRQVELALGPTVFHGSEPVKDTSRLFGVRFESRTYAGMTGQCRFGYGISSRFGIDLTAGLEAGYPLVGGTRGNGWLIAALAAKWRPFRTHDLVALEWRATEQLMNISWTKGFPSRGSERLSTTVGIGSFLPFYVFNPQDGLTLTQVMPASLHVALGYNLILSAGRLSPCAGATGSIRWEDRQTIFGAVMLGFVFAPRG